MISDKIQILTLFRLNRFDSDQMIYYQYYACKTSISALPMPEISPIQRLTRRLLN
jgi:hypothetical protein